MKEESAVVVKDLYKTFRLPLDNHGGIKQIVLNAAKRKKGYEIQRVLNDVSLDIKKGEFFGIVGRNGSGKSTLLKLLAGVYTPDKGLISINGSLTPFIELGVGFNPELTGRENVFLNGALLGFSKKEMESMYDDIVEFAEIDKFMDQKLKNYSSGMQVRLAFSIAIRARSDILLLDEVLAVGDSVFQRKCYTYFKELKKRKQTVIFVSHDTGALQEYCDRAALIEKGKVVAIDKIEPILDRYNQILNQDGHTRGTYQHPKLDDKTKKVYTESIESLLPKDKKFYIEGQDIIIKGQFVCTQFVERPVFGITVHDASGQIVFQSNTLWTHTPNVQDMKPGQRAEVEWRIPNVFNTGSYSVEPGVASSDGTENYHRVMNACGFDVVKKQKSHGFINVEHDLVLSYDKS